MWLKIVAWRLRSKRVCLFVGVLPTSPGFFCKLGGLQCCDLSVLESRKQRSDRNHCVLSDVRQSQWSNDLWGKIVADATEGSMSWPILLEHLDLKKGVGDMKVASSRTGSEWHTNEASGSFH